MLVSVDQLRGYMGNLNMTPAQVTFTETVILPGVQGELEKHCNRPLEIVHMREVRRPNLDGFVVFTVTPVWKVNFIQHAVTGTMVPLPQPPAAPNSIPSFVQMPGMRNFNHVDSSQPLGLPYEYFVGAPGESPYWPMTYPSLMGAEEPSYICDYTGGWKGEEEDGLALAICRVAAREVERQFDDTLSIRGAAQDTATDSDSRLKYWTQDELDRWGRLRRRVAV